MQTRVSIGTQSQRLKAQWEFLRGTFLLPRRESSSGSWESAAVHFAKSGLLSFGDGTVKSDDDPAVVNTVEKLSVVGGDAPTHTQEKEARSLGGILSYDSRQSSY
jgi:hypothetical protein